MHPQPQSDLKGKRLKGKTTIDFLFKKGSVFQSKNLLLRLSIDSDSLEMCVGVSVSKRNFNRAVDRNRVKRQLRTVLKQHENEFRYGGKYMLLYTGKKLPQTDALSQETLQLLKKISASFDF